MRWNKPRQGSSRILVMAKSTWFGADRAPKGDTAYLKGLARRYIIRALNTGERVRRAAIYRRDKNSKPRLIAQGDSWFCYPLPKPVDTLQHLSQDYAVKTLAGGARRLAIMTQPHLLRRLTRTIWQERPQAVLISGGGVDLLDMMNARAARPKGAPAAFLPGPDLLNTPALEGLFSDIESRLVLLAKTALAAGAPKVILVGYDVLRVWPKPGQTIRDSLDMVGVAPEAQQEVVNRLMAMLFATHERAASRVSGCTYVPAQGLAGPYDDWPDEAHAHSGGYAKIANAVRAALALDAASAK